MTKRKRIPLSLAKQGIKEYQNIPINFIEIHLLSTMDIVKQLNMYAYDAYLIKCALTTDTPLLTLDKQLIHIANSIGIKVMEIK